MAAIYIPTAFRMYTQNQSAVKLEAETVGDVLKGLVTQYPELRPRLFTEEGTLQSYVAVFVNSEDIRDLDNEQTPIRERDEVSVITAIACG